MPENTTSPTTRPGQERFVIADDEIGLGAVDAVADESAPASVWVDAWRQLRRRPIFWAASVLIAVAVAFSLVPGLIAPRDPGYCTLVNSYQGPSWGHPFGFDIQGCDIFARTVHGARASVSVGIFTTLVVVLVGSAVGALAGFFGGFFDALLSILTVILVLALFGWPQIARITRGSVMSVKNEDYVTASRALGSGRMAMLLRHVMPNAAAPIIVTATVELGVFIVSEATLSFLGIGLPSSVVSWGADIAAAKDALNSHPSVLLFPAGALALTVLGFIMLGDVVRDALDPKARK